MTEKKTTDSRRKLLKSIAAGSGAIVAGKSLPENWKKPVVNAVILPAHAATTSDATPSQCASAAGEYCGIRPGATYERCFGGSAGGPDLPLVVDIGLNGLVTVALDGGEKLAGQLAEDCTFVTEETDGGSSASRSGCGGPGYRSTSFIHYEGVVSELGVDVTVLFRSVTTAYDGGEGGCDCTSGPDVVSSFFAKAC